MGEFAAVDVIVHNIISDPSIVVLSIGTNGTGERRVGSVDE